MKMLNREPVINHFSHRHPLRLYNIQFPSQPPPCSACNLRHHSSDGQMYSCNICNFSLHLSCAQLPSSITHPSHPIHSLTLLPTPAYSSGAFNCNGCGHLGRGFCYHCVCCGFDLHTSCAQNPLSVSHHSHFHMLQLTFDSPYPNKCFSCDICEKLGSDHWLYRCGACGFDAHMECAMSISSNSSSSSSNVFLPHNYSFPTQQLPPRPLPKQQGAGNYVKGGSSGYQTRPAGNNRGIMRTIGKTLFAVAVQKVGETIVESIIGGGGNDFSNYDDIIGGGDNDFSNYYNDDEDEDEDDYDEDEDE